MIEALGRAEEGVMVVGEVVVVGLGGERKVVGWWLWRSKEEGEEGHGEQRTAVVVGGWVG